MADYTNIQQMVIGPDGELVADQPLSWDGEPLFCRETVQEGLFDRSAFEQMPGQTAFHTVVRIGRWGETFEDVCHCDIGHDH